MCALPIVMAVISVVSSVVTNIEKNKAARRQAKAINEQSQAQSDQLADKASQELDLRARAARRERAAARVAAAESGINLSSNSFLAMLQTSEVNQSIDSGLILKNAKNDQAARKAQTNSLLSQVTTKTGLGILMDGTQAGLQGYAMGGGTFKKGGSSGVDSLTTK